MRRCVVALSLLAGGSSWAGGQAFDLDLLGWRASIDPATLAVSATLDGDDRPVRVSEGAERTHSVENFHQSPGVVAWRLADLGLDVQVAAAGARLTVAFRGVGDATLVWPVTGELRFHALVFPEGEGLYVPFDDAGWRGRMAGLCADMSGQMSMPFWAYRFDSNGRVAGPRTLTYVVRTELRSELCLREQDGRLAATLTHQFQRRDGNGRHEVTITFNGGSPIEPALEFRSQLRERGALRRLVDKIRENPEIARLAGATHMYVWGDGRDAAFIADLKAAGVRRAWIGYDQDAGSGGKLAGPDFVDAAKAAGFLVGPYDTFNNAQDPKTGDAVSRWPGNLYPDGCIVKRDGKRLAGFADRGCELSAEALARAEPTLQPLAERIAWQLHDGANSYFLDVDAFGELHDDFSPAHPMTVFQDRDHRLARLRTLRAHKVVLGSEEGVAWSAPLIDFAHGAFSVRNDVLWKEHKTFGKWWPPDRPGIFFNRVEPSAEFKAAKFDAAFRVPLYEAVFHDSLVATDRWDTPMGQFPSLAARRQLLELLYGVPSMWAMDRRTLREWRPAFSALVAFFQPLHERIATLPLTSFDWLTPDRLVQRTRFGERGEITVTANFGATPFEGLPHGCIEASGAGAVVQRFCAATIALD